MLKRISSLYEVGCQSGPQETAVSPGMPEDTAIEDFWKDSYKNISQPVMKNKANLYQLHSMSLDKSCLVDWGGSFFFLLAFIKTIYLAMCPALSGIAMASAYLS